MEDTPASNIDDEQMTSSPTSPITDETIDAGRITFSIDRPDDDEAEEEEDDVHETKSVSIQSNNPHERKSRPFRHSHSDQPTTGQLTKHNQNFLVPYRHSFEQKHEKRTLSSAITTMPFTSGGPVPLAPYSASSDPGPYRSPWSHTPTNPYGLVNFHFPKSQEHLVGSAQGSMAQLSSLTKILCDEPSVFTPITPR
jgi:hypothetical protein